MKTKYVVEEVAICLLALVVSICFLNVFAVLYHYNGFRANNPSKATDYRWPPYQIKTNNEEGFGFAKMNEEGFNNSISRPESIDILFMGSSHLEGSNIAQKENMAEVYRSLNPEQSVYNIGISGHSLIVCLDNIKNAITEYEPREYIVIETRGLEMNLDSMIQVLDSSRARQSHYSIIQAIISKYFPAIKLIWINLNNWRGVISDQEEIEDNVDQTDSSYWNVVEELLSNISDLIRERDNKLIIVFHPHQLLTKQGYDSYDYDIETIKKFKKICDNEKIIFVDMTEDFRNMYTEQHILAHGFSNTRRGVGHLNKYGHELIAERLSKVILEDKNN